MTSALLDLDLLLSVMVTGNGDVPLAFIEDPAAGVSPGPGEPANLLITTVLRLGLHLVTDIDALTTPLALDWHLLLRQGYEVSLHHRGDPPGRPFCDAITVDPHPGWITAADRLGYLVLLAGPVGIRTHQPHQPGLSQRMHAAARAGMLAAATIEYRTHERGL